MNTVKWGSLGTFKDFSGTIRDLGEDPNPNPNPNPTTINYPTTDLS